MGRYVIVFIDILNTPGVREVYEGSLVAARAVAIKEASIRRWTWFRVIEVKD